MLQPLSRRRFLVIAGVASAGGLLAACSQASPAAPPTAASQPTAAPAPKPTAAPAAAPTAAATLVGAAVPPVAKAGQAVPKDHPTIAALYEAAKKEGKVSWWDQHDQAVAQKFVDAFQKQFPGVTVEFFEGTQDVLKARSIQEARAGRVSFDFIDTGQNWPAYQDAAIVDAKTDFNDILA